MAYYVDYIDDINGKTRTYFDYIHERNKFISDNQEFLLRTILIYVQ